MVNKTRKKEDEILCQNRNCMWHRKHSMWNCCTPWWDLNLSHGLTFQKEIQYLHGSFDRQFNVHTSKIHAYIGSNVHAYIQSHSRLISREPLYIDLDAIVYKSCREKLLVLAGENIVHTYIWSHCRLISREPLCIDLAANIDIHLTAGRYYYYWWEGIYTLKYTRTHTRTPFYNLHINTTFPFLQVVYQVRYKHANTNTQIYRRIY